MNFGDCVLLFFGGWAIMLIGFVSSSAITYIGLTLVTLSYALAIFIVANAVRVTVTNGLKETWRKTNDTGNTEQMGKL